MVKRREPQASIAAIVRREPSAEQIEAFAAGADSDSSTILEKKKSPRRSYKSIRVSFDEHEYLQLDLAAKKAGRSKLNFIRLAILQAAMDGLQEDAR